MLPNYSLSRGPDLAGLFIHQARKEFLWPFFSFVRRANSKYRSSLLIEINQNAAKQ